MEIITLLLIFFIIYFLQSNIYKKYALKRLDYTCKFSKEEAVQGEDIELIEVIKNDKFLPLPWFKTELVTSKWLLFADSDSVTTDKTRFVPSFFTLKPHYKVTRTWKVKCLKRGVFKIKNVIAVTSDLLAVTSFSKGFEINSEITVLPKTFDLRKYFFSPKNISGDIVVKRGIIEDPFYVSGVREYTERDSLNKINWLATARQNEIMVRNNDSTTQQTVTVILNMQSSEFEKGISGHQKEMEFAIRVCASVFDDTLESGMPFRFMANTSMEKNGEDIVTGCFWGEEHVLQCKRLLSQLELYSTCYFSDYLSQVYASISASDIIIVTAYLNEDIFDFAIQKQADGINVKIIVVTGVDYDKVPTECEVYSLYDDVDLSSEETYQ